MTLKLRRFWRPLQQAFGSKALLFAVQRPNSSGFQAENVPKTTNNCQKVWRRHLETCGSQTNAFFGRCAGVFWLKNTVFWRQKAALDAVRAPEGRERRKIGFYKPKTVPKTTKNYKKVWFCPSHPQNLQRWGVRFVLRHKRIHPNSHWQFDSCFVIRRFIPIHIHCHAGSKAGNSFHSKFLLRKTTVCGIRSTNSHQYPPVTILAVTKKLLAERI